MRRRAPGAGNARELRVMEWLTGWGWLCGHRRHIPGAGDILAVRWLQDEGFPDDPLERCDLALIEVKSTIHPYDHFLPGDREDMRKAAEMIGADAWLAYWPARGKLEWIPAADWPPAKPRAQSLFEAET